MPADEVRGGRRIMAICVDKLSTKGVGRKAGVPKFFKEQNMAFYRGSKGSCGKIKQPPPPLLLLLLLPTAPVDEIMEAMDAYQVSSDNLISVVVRMNAVGIKAPPNWSKLRYNYPPV
jgi:hypothetical protein